MDEFRRFGAETAVVSHRGNRRYATTYGELSVLAGRFAAELVVRGIEPGERVVLWGENSAEWIAVFFGCLMRGVIAVPLDAAGTAEFANRVVKDVAARLVMADARLLSSLDGDVARLPLYEIATKLPVQPLFDVSEAVTESVAFQIVFTSGTTLEPKGIVHTHRNVLASLRPIETEMAKYRRYERWVHPLRFLHTLPLSHVFGQFMGLWIPALLAAEVHFVDALEPARMTELIRRERVSVLVAVPRVLQLLRAHLLGRFARLADDLEHSRGLPILKRWWRFRRVHRALGWKFWAVISGGASLPDELESFWNQLGFALIQGYGMTETAALVTLNHPFKIGKGTIGKALPGREVRLSDEGEILVRGDVLAGATWQSGQMRERESEWLATGDLAAKNESGELRFLGRKGDVIVTGAGMNVYPSDLEAAMQQQTGVRGCAVVACETASGPEPVAVVLFAGSDAELQAAVDRANSGLAEYQQIRRALRWPDLQLPYTATGKLLRRKVAAWACAEIAGQRQAVGAEAGREGLLSMVAEVTGEMVAGGDDRLRLSEDLHLDSLGRVQLQSLLEQRLGVELEDDAIAAVRTLGELRALAQVPGAPSSVSPMAAAVPARPPTAEDVYPRWPWSSPVRWLRVVFVEMLMRPLVWAIAAPKVVHAASEMPDGPMLIVCNHVTAYDGALIIYALPPRLRRRLANAMSGEMLLDFRRGRGQGNMVANLLARPAYWLVTALFNVFPLPRMRGFRRSFAHAGEAMDRGYSVLIFPEGTRSRSGEMQRFRPGIGLLAQESRVPIVPVGLVGLGRSTKKRVRSRKIEVRFGEAVSFDEAMGPGALTAMLEARVRQLCSGVIVSGSGGDGKSGS